MEEQQVNNHLIATLIKSRWKIILTTAVFVLAAVIITFFIPKKYVAFGVVYPTNSNSIRDIAGNPDFGFEIQADRLIQLFESKEMKDNIVERFNLIDYYELDTAVAGWRYDLSKNYSTDITFSRTRYLSVAIQARMRDPKLAADVVNTLIHYIDTIRENTYLSNIRLLVDDYESKQKDQEKIVDDIFTELITLDVPSQQNRMTQTRLSQIEERERSGTQGEGDALIKRKLMENPSYQLERLLDKYYDELGVLNGLKAEKRTAEKALDLPFPKVYKLVTAEVDRKKVSPSFLMNGLIGLLLGLFFSVAFVVIQSRWKEVMRQIKQ